MTGSRPGDEQLSRTIVQGRSMLGNIGIGMGSDSGREVADVGLIVAGRSGWDGRYPWGE